MQELIIHLNKKLEMKSALIREINREYLEAVNCYEYEIADNEMSGSSNSYINLAFLYWSFAFEFSIPEDIPEDYSIIGGNRYQIILKLGLKHYPQNAELHFWKEYFQHIIYGEDFSKQDCENLLEKYNDNNLVPYFFLYLFDKEKYREKMAELMLEINVCPIAKNLYIKSIVGKDFI